MGGNGSITESHGEGLGRERARGEREGGTKMLPQSSEREKTLPHVSERGHFPDLRERERRHSPSHQRERSLSPRSETERCFPNLREGDPPEKMLPRSQRERKDAPPDLNERGSPSHQREKMLPQSSEREREDAYPVIKDRDGERERKALPRVLASHPRTQSIHLCCRCKLR